MAPRDAAQTTSRRLRRLRHQGQNRGRTKETGPTRTTPRRRLRAQTNQSDRRQSHTRTPSPAPSRGLPTERTAWAGEKMKQTCLVSTLGCEICGLLYRTPAVQRRAETPHGRQLMQIIPGPSPNASAPPPPPPPPNPHALTRPHAL